MAWPIHFKEKGRDPFVLKYRKIKYLHFQHSGTSVLWKRAKHCWFH